MAFQAEPENRGQRIKLIVAGVIFLTAGGVAWYSLGGSSAERLAATHVYKCVQCGHEYEHIAEIGEIDPLECPQCGQRAAYPAEACYWTKGPDGEWKAKKEPTWVVLKRRYEPDTDEKTYCPDCGREVVGHNPLPPQELMDAANAEASP